MEDSEGGRTAMRSSGCTRDLSAVLEGKEEEREVGSVGREREKEKERKHRRERERKGGREEGKDKREEGREDDREREITTKRLMKPNQP